MMFFPAPEAKEYSSNICYSIQHVKFGTLPRQLTKNNKIKVSTSLPTYSLLLVNLSDKQVHTRNFLPARLPNLKPGFQNSAVIR